MEISVSKSPNEQCIEYLMEFSFSCVEQERRVSFTTEVSSEF